MDPYLGNDSKFQYWLNHYDSEDQLPENLTIQFVNGLNDIGINVYRSSLWLPTSHPELWGTQVVWNRDNGAQVFRRDHSITSTSTYLNTPGEAVHKSRHSIDWRLDNDNNDLPYPLLEEIKEEGGTHYVIIPFHTDHQTEQAWMTFATKREGGFSKLELSTLKAFCIPLGWKVRVSISEIATKSLLSVYIGSNAAKRVINGNFKRGTGEKIDAVIWFCDMRGSTILGDNLPAHEYVSVLDQYFECIAKPIEENGGEILKFIGDAILAIFPIENNAELVCTKVLNGAISAIKDLREWSEKPENPNLEAGIALHRGEVFYGNIGGSSRLDFTVIGSAVNEASRIESMCKSIAPLLASHEFAKHLPANTMTSLGKKTLSGVNLTHEIYTLSEFSP